MNIQLILMVAWPILAILNYKAVMAYSTHEWPLLTRAEGLSGFRTMAILMAVLGPFGTFVLAVNGAFKHGFKINLEPLK